MKKVVYVAGAIVGVGVLGFAYYAISPLFINITADEALPGMKQEPAPAANTDQPAPTPVQPPPQVSTGAPIVDTPAHPASGQVKVVTAGDQQYVRYEDFKTINGPDLFVYLATDLEATEFVNLGRLKATEGNVNYEIPDGVDLSKYRYALVWCKAFSVLFNSADLALAQ